MRSATHAAYSSGAASSSGETSSGTSLQSLGRAPARPRPRRGRLGLVGLRLAGERHADPPAPRRGAHRRRAAPRVERVERGERRRARAAASATPAASTETQSRLAQAGTTPRVLSSPRVGFSPTSPLNAAGTRPEPAVSVPSAKATWPSATATRRAGARAAADARRDRTPTSTRRTGCGSRPARSRTGPCSSCRRAARPRRAAAARPARCCSATRANPGQPAVVGMPATSMLSLTANGIPYSGRSGSASSSACAAAQQFVSARPA